MTDKPTKYMVPTQLREKLSRIAIETDIIAGYRGVESWRVAAVHGARCLLRCAAECDDMPRMMRQSLAKIAALAHHMSSQVSEKRTKSGEMALELEKFLESDE